MCISIQVLQEFYISATQKLKPGLPIGEARRDVRALLARNPAQISAGLIKAVWGLMDYYALSSWDAQIVAAAMVSECAWLVSEDMQDGQDIGGMTIINPFSRKNAPLLDKLLLPRWLLGPIRQRSH